MNAWTHQAVSGQAAANAGQQEAGTPAGSMTEQAGIW